MEKVMKLLYEKQLEVKDLEHEYLRDLSENDFTLGYALTKGFNNVYLHLSSGRNICIGYLYRDIYDGDKLRYEGGCSDSQLDTVCELTDVYRTDDYTEIVVVCVNKSDEEKFKEMVESEED